VVEIRQAVAADIEPCTAVLSRAFLDDPGAIVFEPDRKRRKIILPSFFRTFVTAAILEGGDLIVPAEDVTGLASWFGPDSHGPSEAAKGVAGFSDVITTFGPEAAERMLAMVGEIEAQHAKRMPEPHLRLEFFGVDPVTQGRGIGSALARHGHDRADALGLPCYLETFTTENVAYYNRRGYDVIGTFVVGDGVPVHAMRREPRVG
jgi:ribosomal protein S18 acetylase RimI-like enzyme